MPNESNRNLIAFMAIAMGVLLAYNFLIMEPAAKKRLAAEKARAAAQPAAATAQGPLGPDGRPAPIVVSRQAAMGPAELRRPIANGQLSGTLSLKGGRIDDLSLTHYPETLGKGAPPVRLLNPEGSKDAWFTNFGWSGLNVPGLPGPDTVWTLQSGDTLSPGKPVVLTYTSPQNLVFVRTLTLDENFMFTVRDTVNNQGAAAVVISPYAQVVRQGLPATRAGQPPLGGNGIVQEGAIGVFGPKGQKLQQIKYPAWLKKPEQSFDEPGWLGITDKYWLVAIAPADPGSNPAFTGRYLVQPGPVATYRTDFAEPKGVTLAAGKTITQTTKVFAGAKVKSILEGYEQAGLPNFLLAIDWGIFRVLTQPFFTFLELLKGWIGNFGLAILALTVCVRLVLFPLANKSYESMTKMKKLQPQLEELKAKFKDDPAKQQQEMMAIYAREKINPLMGCLPMLLQIPVFFSVYKVLSVTIEMRHTPFMGWIHDLSGQDPTTLWNLFGLIPWHPDNLVVFGNAILAGHLHLGVLPLLYGFTMWLTTAMNPPAPDPMQQRIFQLMPVMFTFIMATFPVGLLIYWTWSNVLSILQQYVIMHRLKVDNPIDSFIAQVRGLGHAKAAG